MAGLMWCMWCIHRIPTELLGRFCSCPSVSALLCSAKCSDTGGCPDNRRAKVFVVIAVEFLSPSILFHWAPLKFLSNCERVIIRTSILDQTFDVQLAWFCHFAVATPLTRINWVSEPPGYAKNTDNWISSLMIRYIGSLQFGCYYLQ
jgi:hypothetical protein